MNVIKLWDKFTIVTSIYEERNAVGMGVYFKSEQKLNEIFEMKVRQLSQK